MTYCTLESSPVAGLKPELFWKHFYELTRVPRPSGHEEAAGDYAVSVAKRLNLPFKRDDAGNVVISKPGSAGHEKAPIVVLQSHLDMVCEKNKGVAIDFSRDPIKLLRKGDMITADGTSLGADNAAGVAASLAVLESEGLVHPPLECLFTVDEEAGMTGTKALKPGFIEGRRLMNLDSEDEGVIFIGCAGGSDNELRLAVKKIAPAAATVAVRAKVMGLKGGHSGLDIHKGRGNAIKMLARFLTAAARECSTGRMASFTGGSKRNAIPREAEALLVIDPSEMQKLETLAAQWQKTFQAEYAPVEDNIQVVLEKDDKPGEVYCPETGIALLELLNALAHGVLAMSRTLAGLVETSTNVAIVREEKGELIIDLSHRSSSMSSLASVDESTRSLASLCNIRYHKGDGYPGWQPDVNSAVLATAKKVYKELFNKEVHVEAIHAGLECGLIGEKYPGMDMISFGPTLQNVHSPDEVINIPSTELFWKYLKAMLEALA